MLKLIFKKQLYPNFSEVKDIDFNTFTFEDIVQLDEKPRIKTEKKPSDHLEEIEESSSSDSSEEGMELLEVPQPTTSKSGKKRNIESKLDPIQKSWRSISKSTESNSTSSYLRTKLRYCSLLGREVMDK